MRRALIAVCLLVACRAATPRPDPPAARSAASVAPSASASAASAPPAAPASFALVASVDSPTLRVFGSHVSVSSGAFQASADGDGPLVSGDDVMTGLAYKSGEQDIWLVGAYPNVFAFRRDDDGEPCWAIDHPTALARHGAAWSSKPLARDPLPPHAVVAWNGGMLIVDSQIDPCGWATASPLEAFKGGPGTKLTFVAQDASVSHPSLGLDPNFIALGASTRGEDLAFVGTYGDAKVATRDVVVVRRHGNGAFRPTVLVHGTGWHVQSHRTTVRELGAAALVLPPPARDDGSLVKDAPAEGGDEITFKGHAASIFVVDDAGATERAFRDKSEQDCWARDAVLAGRDVLAVVACPKTRARLVRIAEDGARSAVSFSCEPRSVEVSGPGDVWVAATCGVFRLGHPQTPLREKP